MARITHRNDRMHRGLVPTAQLGSGSATSSTVLLGNQTWGSVPGTSFGSNSNSVGSANAPGASSSNARADHVHQGVHQLTSNGSNGRFEDVNFAAGSGIALGVSGQTVTITNTGSSGGGGGGSGTLTTIEEVDGSPTSSSVTKLVFPNGTLGIVGTVATYTPTSSGGSGERALVDPTGLTWSWINQGGASIATSGAGLWLSSGAESADNWHLRAKTVPSKPYTIIVHLRPLIMPIDFSSFGVGWLQTSDNHFAVFNQHSQSGVPHVTSSKSGTNYAITVNYTDLSGQGEYYRWVKLTDDASNRKIYLSPDGNNWVQFHSVATNDFVTPDRLIFGINARNATYGAGVLIDSWEEA